MARPSLFAPTLCVLAFASASPAATWIVDQAGGGDAATIQGAVDLASTGDEIRIHAGTYPEAVITDKALSFVGVSGRDVTIVNTEGREYGLKSTPDSGATLLDGLTFAGTGWDYSTVHAIQINGDATIRNCAVVDNKCVYAPVQLSDEAVIEGTTLARNRALGGWQEPAPVVGCISGGSMLITNCEFDDNRPAGTSWARTASILEFTGNVVVSDCVIRNHSSLTSGALFQAHVGTLTLRNNLFVDNDANQLISTWWLLPGEGVPVLDAESNTFARSGFVEPPEIAAGSRLRANVFTGSDVGLHVPVGVPVSAECNDAFGNLANWIGLDPVSGGNFSAPPLYCAPDLDDFTVASNSPLLPPHNTCGIRIGAFREGCGPVSTKAMTWGRIKGAYR